MNRLEFMQKLESLLSDISQREREEALQYYNDYLNDAGVENEQEVLESLGAPEKLANTIREGLSDNQPDGEFTETGYKTYSSNYEKKNELVKKGEKGSLSSGMIVLLIILCILASPLLISIATGIFGAGTGLVLGLLGLVLGITVAGIALLVTAVVLFAVGIGMLFYSPLPGICLIGAGLLLAGLSLFFIWFTVWFYGVAVPWTVRAVADLFSRIFHRKGGENV